MKGFKDFSTFKKVVRKYWKRHAKRSSFKYNGKKITEWWVGDNIWCYYLVSNKDELNHTNIRDWFRYDVHEEELDDFISTFKEYYYKDIKVIVNDNEVATGFFEGFVLVNNGVYFGITETNKKEISLYPLYCKFEKIC